MAPIMKANHIIGYNSFKAGYPKLDSPNVQVKENKTRHEKYEVPFQAVVASATDFL